MNKNTKNYHNWIGEAAKKSIVPSLGTRKPIANIPMSSLVNSEGLKAVEEVNKKFAEMHAEEERRKKLSDDANQAQIDSQAILKNIEENTSYLKDVVTMLNNTNEKQDEILSLLQDILSLSSEKDKKKADSKVRNIMDKINSTVNDAETMMKLSKLLMAIYGIISPFLN